MFASHFKDGTLLKVWVQPRASKTQIIGIYGDSIKIAVKSPPAGGKANEECIDFLSGILDLPKRQFTIKSGQSSRSKSIFIKGVAPDRITVLLEHAMGRQV